MKLDGAAGTDAVEGRRPTAVPAPAAAACELPDRPRRRTFTGQDKLRILTEIDRAPAGGTAAILRREGLDPERLARIARRWRARRSDAGQTRTLEFLARDMAHEPARIRPVPRSLVSRAKALVRGVEVDVDAPLPDDEA
jgi:prlF antitoxin for toxin YhaV_toxin